MKQEDIQKALQTIQVHEIGTDIFSAKILVSITPVDDHFTLMLDFPEDRGRQLTLEAALKKGLHEKGLDIKKIRIKFQATAPGSSQPAAAPGQHPGVPPARVLKGVKHIFAVGSGKGGVGKSTVAINLAGAIASRGYKTGLLDADIYGPSIGTMAGFEGRADLDVSGDKIIPAEKFGMKLISFSLLIEPTKAVVWRGPMLGKALEQMLFDIEWGDLDFLVIDMPPGTGDVQLSLAQLVELDGFVLVTTPQKVAIHDVERAADMLRQVNIPILGVVENMSEFICPHCGETTHIFSSEGGLRVSDDLHVPLLGKIPLNRAIMESGETGIPVTVSDIAGEGREDIRKAYAGVVDILLNKLGIIK